MKKNWTHFKGVLWDNFMALMQLFAGEDDFIRHGSKKWQQRQKKK